MLSFKFIHEGDIRRIQIDSDIDYESFLTTVKELFKLGGKAETHLYYEDKQYDKVIISSDNELKEAIIHLKDQSTIVIIIKHYLKHVDFDDIIDFLNEFKDILMRCYLFVLFILNYPLNTYFNYQKLKKEEEYAIVELKLVKKLDKLNEMGFDDIDGNKKILRENNYSLRKTVEILLK